MRRYLDERPMDEVATERLRGFEPEAIEMDRGGYWLAFSGGKDSVVILDLAKRSGVKFEAHHNLTTCDPPELVRFVKTFPDVQIDKPPLTMWQLIRKRGLPPLRHKRYCCRALKERGGIGRFVVTGIRWSESTRRASRRMVEQCFRIKSKYYLSPIIDWPTGAVWEYIHEQRLRYCSLYDEGQKRVGCVLCPMVRDVARQIERWPHLARAWERAIKATFDTNDPAMDGRRFTTAQEYWEWWIDRDAPSRKDDQPVLFEDDPDLTEHASAASAVVKGADDAD